MERRLAAILCADLVGYSRMMGQDEAGTLTAINAVRAEVLDPLIANYSGRVVKSTGDGILAEFSSAVAAVEAAHEIQVGMARRNNEFSADLPMQFRIGINLGDIMIEDGDIFGDGVNVAARLEARADPGAVLISGIVHDQVRKHLDLSFHYVGELQLKNIADPVRAYRLASDISGEAHTSSKGSPALPDKPSVAVLPFNNMSGNEAQEYFSDGITEDIITELSRFRGLFVIARNSSFTYKGKAVNVQQVGRELGVHYVLEGSVRLSGNRIRVNAQLIDTETGHHVWAERYDRGSEDVFAVQDELTETIAATLEGRVGAAAQERARRKPPGSLKAYDYVLRGEAIISRTSEDNRRAREMFLKATELDPDCARAWAGIAMSNLIDWLSRWGNDLTKALDQAYTAARKAVALDELDGHSHRVLGNILLQQGEFDRSREHLEWALGRNPNDANSYCSLGALLTCVREPQKALKAIATAIRLNPHHPSWYLWYRAAAQIMEGSCDEAVASLRTALARFPDFVTPRRHLAVCYMRLGRESDARAEVAEILRLDPGYNLASLAERLRFKHPEDSERYLDDLRRAGVPEE